MLHIDPKKTPTPDVHQYLLGAVAPRPIAFVSTVDEDGRANLAPYSFFNCFSSNPPTLVFSSNRKVSDNTTKDTLHNVKVTKEVVVNVVPHSILRQMAVTSIAFPTEESEFVKSGLTPIPSDLVKAYRVKESPVQMECKVIDIIALGDQGGAGNLIVCEVLRMHIDENILDNDQKIDPQKIDLMGRMGRAFYVRASGDAVQKVFQAVGEITLGFDQLPASIRSSAVLTGNNLGQLAGLKSLPLESEIRAIMKTDTEVKKMLLSDHPKDALHQYAKKILDSDDSRRMYAAAVAMAGDLE